MSSLKKYLAKKVGAARRRTVLIGVSLKRGDQNANLEYSLKANKMAVVEMPT